MKEKKDSTVSCSAEGKQKQGQSGFVLSTRTAACTPNSMISLSDVFDLPNTRATPQLLPQKTQIPPAGSCAENAGRGKDSLAMFLDA